MNPEILQRLEQFQQRGIQLKQTLNQSVNSASNWQNLGNLATDILGSKYLPKGAKRSGKKIAQSKLANQKKQAEEKAVQKSDQWIEEIIQYLKTVSKITGNITPKGNSSQLVRKLNSAKSAVKIDTKITKGIQAIELLKSYDLAYNHELKDILKEKTLSKVKTPNYREMVREAKTLLRKYPAELESFLGAIERLEKGGLDCHRQCLSSCRNCVEGLVKKRSGEKEWNVGLNKIVPSETRRKTVKITYGYLSAYGSHGGETPNEEDAKTGIEQTMAAVRIIVAHN